MTKRIFATIVCICLMFSLTACESKKPISADDFTRIMEDNDFTIKNVTEELESSGLTEEVLFASCNEYIVEFYILKDSETGESVFYYNKEVLDDKYSTTSFSTEINFNNYNYYAFNADGEFHLVARIDDTMIFCEADKEYRDDIIDIIETLGYK